MLFCFCGFGFMPSLGFMPVDGNGSSGPDQIWRIGFFFCIFLLLWLKWKVEESATVSPNKIVFCGTLMLMGILWPAVVASRGRRLSHRVLVQVLGGVIVGFCRALLRFSLRLAVAARGGRRAVCFSVGLKVRGVEAQMLGLSGAKSWRLVGRRIFKLEGCRSGVLGALLR